MSLLAQAESDSFDWRGGLEDLWSDVTGIVPKIIVALIILVIGWFIAKAIRSLVSRILQTINFDTWIDKSGLGAPLERAGFADSGSLLAKIVYWLIMMIVIQFALFQFGEGNPLSEVFDSLVAFIPKLIVAIAIVIITGIVANFVKDLVAGALSGESYGKALSTLAMAGIWFIGGTAALDQIGVANEIVTGVFSAVLGSLSLILILKFGIGGIDSARERFWPKVYDLFESDSTSNNA
jgi:hypothetical protein